MRKRGDTPNFFCLISRKVLIAIYNDRPYKTFFTTCIIRWRCWSIIDIHFYVTFYSWIKIASLKKHFRFPPLLIRPLGLCTQAIQLGVLITFEYIFSILIIFVHSCNVCVFYFCIFCNKLDLLEATWSIIVVS